MQYVSKKVFHIYISVICLEAMGQKNCHLPLRLWVGGQLKVLPLEKKLMVFIPMSLKLFYWASKNLKRYKNLWSLGFKFKAISNSFFLYNWKNDDKNRCNTHFYDVYFCLYGSAAAIRLANQIWPHSINLNDWNVEPLSNAEMTSLFTQTPRGRGVGPWWRKMTREGDKNWRFLDDVICVNGY